jgi:hypothetical protein
MVKKSKALWCKELWTLGMKDNKLLRLLAYVSGLSIRNYSSRTSTGGGKPDPAGTPAGATPAFRCGEVRSGRDR